MATIASPIDFTGEVNIPNSDDAYTGVQATVQSLIDEYEPQLLTELLGEELYTEFKAGLLIDPIPEKWVTLRDKVKPMILKYVYFYYLEANIVQTTGIGAQATTSEAGNRASAWGKQVKEWNKMVRAAHELVKFLTNNDDYPDYTPPLYYDFEWVWGADYWLGCYGYKVPEIYTFKNSLGI